MSFPATGQVDLTNCDREPIHIAGQVQPFGFLLAASADWLVSRASANVKEFLGVAAEDMLGQPLGSFLPAQALHDIRNRITLLRGPDAVERLFGIVMAENRQPFDVALHFSGQTIVIEAEPSGAEPVEQGNLIRTLIARLNQASTLQGFLREAARQVHTITGFDRVMVYRFDHTGAGEVVAEALRPGTDSFLGLNYPASDIPAQARALYVRNIFRVIADVGAPPSPVLPVLDGAGQPLDLSLCVLRAVSPIHLEYLRNMGVQASLSISIVVQGKLWGLFACHHYEPLRPSFAQRSAAELYGYLFSLMLESRERSEVFEYERRARGIADRLMSAAAQDSKLLSQADWIGEMTLEAIPADGVGVCISGAVSLNGLTPPKADFLRILQFMNQQPAADVFATEAMSDHLPNATGFSHLASGMLAIPISRMPRDYIVLFRAERLRTVRWAGNPEKPVEFGPNGARLTPRKSFEEWQQLVKGRAVPFSAAELDVARTLRTAILEVVLQLSEEVGEERRRAQEQQLLLIAELNHRVRNILALIRGLVSQSRQGSAVNETFVRTLDFRLQALARAHDQITAHRWGPGRLIELIQAEAGAYLGAKRDRLILTGPDVLIEPTAFTVLALLFHELITNAAKYGALSDNGTVHLSWDLDADRHLRLHWRESGGPPVKPSDRRGFGSTIIERSVPFELGGEAEVSHHLSGVEARFSVPSRHVAGCASATAVSDTPAAIQPAPTPLDGCNVLLVEDSMMVALDAEDMLMSLGANSVAVAPSVASARRVLEARMDVAILDFNLGHETSLEISDMLLERQIPFVFATGYGEALDLPAALSHVPITVKPYTADTLAVALTRALRKQAPSA